MAEYLKYLLLLNFYEFSVYIFCAINITAKERIGIIQFVTPKGKRKFTKNRYHIEILLAHKIVNYSHAKKRIRKKYNIFILF